jgi:2-polyprenyl-3-methyl-5-hydroxy-6-metoxy-1,4-benzoquinol methylase
LFRLPNVQIVLCDHCGLEYVNPLPPASAVQPYVFHSLDYVSPGTQIDLCYLEKILAKYRLLNCRLLDLGCGAGRLEPGLIRLGWRPQNLYLMDACAAALDAAQTVCPAANFIPRDVETGTGFTDFFDCILMVEFLEDVTHPREVMRHALDALKPGGFLIMRGMPNNDSVEAFIGRDKWGMRAMDHHYYFFNPRTFSRFLDTFPRAQLLEFGCFLQAGYRFYHVPRIARDIGLVERSGQDVRLETADAGPSTLATFPCAACPTQSRGDHWAGHLVDELTWRLLDKLKQVDFETYPHRARLPQAQLLALSTAQEVEAFFDKIHLDYVLAPDFSAVVKKTGV